MSSVGKEEGVLANCCLISQLGRRERSEQGLQCRLVWADERVCLRREQHCFEELVVRLLYGRQVGAENRRGAHGTERVDRGAKPCRVDLVHRLSTDAHSSCRSRTWPPTARTSADVANSSDGIGAPKQSELNSTPVRASRDPVVEGLSNSGGRKACRWRSPNSRAWPGLSRKTRSRGTAHSRDMIPGPRKVVTRRAVGAASKSGHRPPVWSRSGWVIQSHRTSAGLSTSARTETKSDFVSVLAEVLNPADVRWLWITHPDRDHTGGLWPLLEAAPTARLVTTFLGPGIMSLEWAVPLDRVFLLNPGQALEFGDRHLHAFSPPLFDSPSTTGSLDARTGVLFSSDCFGAPMPSEELATSADVRAVGGQVRDLQLLWASVDSRCTRSTRQGFAPRSTRSVPWAP